MSTIDFEDGDGPQLAAPHRNPDGSEGGWVAATALVSPAAYVSELAWVYGEARVDGRARIDGPARVCGKAHVEDGACIEGPVRVEGRARLAGTARVSGASFVGGDAVLRGTMFGYTELAGDSTVGEGVKILPMARIPVAGAIEADAHYFCGVGGPITLPWTFYRGKGSTIWLCVSRTAQPVEKWIELCEQAGAESLPGFRATGTALRVLLDQGIALDVLRDW